VRARRHAEGEAEHRRRFLEHHRHLLRHVGQRRHGRQRRRIAAERLHVAADALLHARDRGGIRRRHVVGEEIDREGPLRLAADLADRRTDRLGRHHRGAERAQAAGVRDRGDQFGRRGPRHRREHDRVRDIEALKQSPVGPHGIPPS